MEETFATAIRKAREAAGLTQSEVADLLSASKGYVSQLETGFRTGITGENLIRLCAALKVPQDYFARYLAPDVTVPPPPATLSTFQIHPVDIPSQPPIPILGTVGAGPALDEPSYEVLDFSKLFAGDLAAYTVIGDSMRDSHILSGDTIIIRKTPSPAPGEDVVAWIDAHKGCVIKTFRGGRATLGWLASDDGWRHDLTEADTVYGALVSIIRSKRPAIVQKPKKKPKKKGK